ncbi:CRISPR-associated endonuclease Cas2 [Thioflexithrix psekupsensis]|uniref:CRISPR-associated endoribonuclease Cas2 n=1 Tax=Thioflexithrix psekupsensis TaxID=1570016 RepID=A0A251X655_9GAMM|nr:CRISPR-associated endonuclease Cas2 [Thioflexithrix psekupsensis]OUD13077.1 CRISPR-associated endonuclease Cas2 [Thioflexithrix psekupsensis]
MYVVVFYDVPAKRTRLFYKLLARYLHWRQNSVFCGDLTEATYKRLRRELAELSEDDDRLAFVSTENRHNVTVEFVEHQKSRLDDGHQGSEVL